MPPRNGDIEIPISHEKSQNGRTSVVSFGKTTPIEFDKKSKRNSLPCPNFYDRFTPNSFGKFQSSGILIKSNSFVCCVLFIIAKIVLCENFHVKTNIESVKFAN